jgi:hypothetical protein
LTKRIRQKVGLEAALSITVVARINAWRFNLLHHPLELSLPNDRSLE